MDSIIFNTATLLIVFVGMVLFRQSDKSNRKIAKLSRFADKMREDFEIMVNNKTREFNDTITDFDLINKQGRGLLNELAKNEAEIKQRLLDMSQQGQEIKESQDYLHEVLAAVQEIRSQVDFISDAQLHFKDNHKKIKRIGEGLASLEKDSNAMVDNVRTNMEEQFVQVLEGVQNRIGEFEDRVSKIEEITEHRIDTNVQKVVEKFALRIRDLESTITAAGESALEKVHFDIRKLQDEVQMIVKKSSDQLRNAQLEGEEKFIKLQSDLESMDHRIKEKNVEWDILFSEAKDKLETKSNELEIIVEQRMENISDSLHERINESNEDVAQLRKNYGHLESDMQDLAKENEAELKEIMQSAQEKVKEVREKLLVHMEKQFNIQEEKMKKVSELLDAEFKDKFNSLEKNFQHTLNQQNEKKEELLMQLDLTLKEREAKIDELDKRIFSSEKRMITSFDNQVKKVNEEIHKLNLETIARRNELVEEVRQEAERAIKSMENFEKQYEVAEVRYNDRISETMKSLNEELENFRKSFRESHNQLDADAQKRIAELYHKFGSLEKNMELSQKQLTETTLEVIKKEQKEFAEKNEKSVEEITNQFIQLENQINKIQNNANQGLQKFQEQLRLEMDKIEDKNRLIIKDFSDKKITAIGELQSEGNQIEENLENLWQEIKNYEKQTNIFQKTEELRQELKADLAFFTENLSVIKVENKEMEKTLVNIQELKAMRREVENELVMLKKKREQIGNFEDDIKLAINLSQQVGDKMESLRSMDHRLNAFHGEMERIQTVVTGLQKEAREFLQKKNEIQRNLELVSHSDANMKKLFSRVDSIASQLEKIEIKGSNLQAYLEDVNSKSLLLTNREKEIQDVQRRFDQIESLMEDLEKRRDQINSMNQRLEKIRQFMMEAEQRLEVLNQKAADKIRSFAEFMQAVESQNGSEITKTVSPVAIEKSRGMVDEKRQKTVLKLHDMGWPIREISEKLSMQESEVNFIVNSLS